MGTNLTTRTYVAGIAVHVPVTAGQILQAKNWVEQTGDGHLPSYIKRISKHLREKGMDESRAIATAVNVAKKMCDSGDLELPGKQEVNPGSRAEACAAVAEWDKKKAEAKAS